ncbi:MAG: OmpP1/FadL family transporter [Bacteroidota bacterium]
MKRYITTACLIVLSLGLFAQNQTDALRYSWLNPSGTARFNSMGGAFNSLGGDFGAISQNPAGLGVYRSSELTFTPGMMYSATNSEYLNNKEHDFNYNSVMGNIGYVGTILLENESDILKSMSFAFGYNQLQNFNQVTDIKGYNDNGSMTNYFAASSDGNRPENLGDFYEWPAYYSFLIDPLGNDSTTYISSYDAYGTRQKELMQKSGNVGEYVFAMGVNLDDMFYLGASFGIQNVSFEQSKFYEESDPDDVISDFNYFTYKDRLVTDGTGYNLKLGGIVRPVDWLRASVAIHTPTFYNLHDEYSTEFVSNFDDTDKSTTYKSPTGIYNYKLTSPFRAQAGLAAVIYNNAIISVDYEFLNYGISKLRANDEPFDIENDIIAESYGAAHNIRAGAEYRFGPVAFRAGWAYFDSPYVDGEINSGADFMQYSGGIGFRSKSFFFDLAYVYYDRNEKYFLYEGYGVSSPVVDQNMTRHTMMATLGFRF